MTSIKLEKNDNIIHLIFDKENSSVNLMDIAFADDLANAVDRILTQEFDGVIVRSAKSTFFVGGDINLLYKTNDENIDQLSYMVDTMKSAMRQLETCGKPVIACINGSALGGGFELALACHYRIALNTPKISLGLPEVTLGLLPGAGGVTRLVRLLGLQAAMPYLVQGKLFNPTQGQALTLIDELVDDESDLIAHAIKGIKNCVAKQTTVEQPWDVKGYKIPGGSPKDNKVTQTLPISPALVRAPSKGTLPAPEKILATMVEGAQVDFDNASKIESRYFLQLAKGQISKNLINTFWTQLNEIKAGKNRPKEVEKHHFTKVAVIGAGMMGAGIAYACAIKGITVVLKDTCIENAEKGKDYSRKILAKQLDKKRISSEKAEQVLALIIPSEEVNDLKGCEMVIEAVFENTDLKAKVTQECEAVMDKDAIFATNTSTLPISKLATASERPENFIGLHFFSPVDKMQLIEIICGEKTCPRALALCYDISLQLGKTPIVVNDSRGFYTSRVFTTYVKEGTSLLKDCAAASIENAAYLNGFPVGPLAVTDEVTLTLFEKINAETKADCEKQGREYIVHPADDILYDMIAKQRTGKSAGQGFYQYPADAKKSLWSELNQYKSADNAISLQDIKDRLLFIMAIETVRCVEEDVLRSAGDANIGATIGIGYPHWTGGTLQFINQYGLENFIERANQLANLYGERFAAPKLLSEMAQAGKTF
jgi:3-hydroxyacyl-CoA dehydrogenase/enoyl-CoA hydratase/3-hydroxybutyryl-CoA epimerase